MVFPGLDGLGRPLGNEGLRRVAACRFSATAAVCTRGSDGCWSDTVKVVDLLKCPSAYPAIVSPNRDPDTGRYWSRTGHLSYPRAQQC
jgi:hypothetical protein